MSCFRKFLVHSLIIAGVMALGSAAHTQTIAGRYAPMNGGHTIKDTQTGLIWMRCSVGQEWNGSACMGEVKTAQFDEAQTYAKWLNGDGGFAGARNWRLPTVDELQSLRYCSTGPAHIITSETLMGVTRTRNNGIDMTAIPVANDRRQVYTSCADGSTKPTINTEVFPDTLDGWYWTSSPYAGDSYNAWLVDFGEGYVGYYYRHDPYPVRLVRVSQ